MFINFHSLSTNIRIYAQLLASILKSSYVGIVIYLLTIFFSKKSQLKPNNVIFGIGIFGLILLYSYPLIVLNSDSSISYLRTILLWNLPIIYYAVGSCDLNHKIYQKILILMMFYTLTEFLLINFTGISFFESDRLRAAHVFGSIRAEGVAHNSSISSALVASIFLKIHLKNGFSAKFFLLSLVSIILLGSGAGMLLFLFVIIFFVINKKILSTIAIISIISIIFGLVLLSSPFSAEVIGNIHEKISFEYILFLIDLKIDQAAFIYDSNFNDLLFGFSILDNVAITSGDFGYLTMIVAIGILPSMSLLFGILVMFLKASRIGNFGPFLILMIENFHYPVLIDPISAYILAQYAISKNSEK
jgi:hypothetical protein